MSLPQVLLADRLLSAATSRGEGVVAEVLGTVRRIRLLIVVLAVSVPAFLAGCLGVLAWWLLV
jgi:hypothetical protein